MPGCHHGSSRETQPARGTLMLNPQTAIDSLTLRGIVLSDDLRQRVASATVELPDLRLRTVVGEDGRFTLFPVGGGPHLLRVVATRYEPLERPIEMPTGHGAAIAVLLARPAYCLDYCPQGAVTHPPSRVENVR
jgi:hypothetical protein